jgi:molybdenum cofactor biosynthesis enzyme MoaA
MSVTLAQLVAPLAVGATLRSGYAIRAIDEAAGTITLASPRDPAPLIVQLRPRDPSRPCFQATRSLNVSYVGEAALGALAMRAMREMLDVLARNDRGSVLATKLPVVSSTPGARDPLRIEDGIGYVRIDSTCEMSCIFCTRGEGGSLSKPRPLSSSSDVERDIDRLVEMGARIIAIGGDEPLTHPDAESFVRRARRGSVTEVHLATSGQRLVDLALVKRLAAAGLTRVQLPVYGPSADVHDAITKEPGSFDALAVAMRNVRAAGLSLRLHTVLLRQNLAHVAAMRTWARATAGVGELAFAHVMPRSDAVDDYRAKTPSYEEVRRVLGGSGVTLLYFPTCVTSAMKRASGTDDAASPNHYTADRMKPAPCNACMHASACPGTFELHVRAFGESELVPVLPSRTA